ncbi:MAG: GIY-YIG nuclease family protein [Sphingopyxis granuli]
MYYLYIMASQKNGTIYIGVTNDIIRRTYEHREGQLTGLSQKYRVKHLVHYEEFQDIRDAIQREKRLKKWNRAWKIQLIETQNPDWRDLWFDLNR